nr:MULTISPECIES: excalibur domain-containing protein [unclassified Mycobacterium]
MRKLTVLIIGFAVGLILAASSGASPSDVTFMRSTGPYVAPMPQAPGSSCDPNYSGACVPIASDVDCAGGGGNGPAYVSGPVTVVGKDIYGLDRDGNGVGCE